MAENSERLGPPHDELDERSAQSQYNQSADDKPQLRQSVDEKAQPQHGVQETNQPGQGVERRAETEGPQDARAGGTERPSDQPNTTTGRNLDPQTITQRDERRPSIIGRNRDEPTRTRPRGMVQALESMLAGDDRGSPKVGRQEGAQEPKVILHITLEKVIHI